MKWDKSYPIESVSCEICSLLEKSHDLIISASPGSGKTTILPLELLECTFLQNKQILILEPRRLIAKMSAMRMASLLNENIGETIGFIVRQERKFSKKTKILFVTEGILIRMLQSNPELPETGLLIFDEFHERSLFADLGLALALDARNSLRPDLRIMIMSATIQPDPLLPALKNGKIIQCEGSLFPVDVIYMGKPDSSHTLFHDLCKTIFTALQETSGDILVFLPGYYEIKRIQRLLDGFLTDSQILVFPLHSTISKEEQQHAIQPAPKNFRKIILSSAIAESSLTIEGITAVVDSCLERISQFNLGTGMNHLVTRLASLATLNQRKGRAGRLCNGRCYRMINHFTELNLNPFPEAEILRTDLTSLVLELILWGNGQNENALFWLTPPPRTAYQLALNLLLQIQAINENPLLVTEEGRQMADSIVHPRLANMILKAKSIHCAELACGIAAILTEPDFMKEEILLGVDIENRLIALQNKKRFQIDLKKWENCQATYLQIQNSFNVPILNKTWDLSYCGLLLAFAFPDQIALKREEKKNFYLMASGRAVLLPPGDILANSSMIVIANFDDQSENGKIKIASSIDDKVVRRYFEKQIKLSRHLQFDNETERVICHEQTCLGAIKLTDKLIPSVSFEEALPILMEFIKKRGITKLPWSKNLIHWRERVTFLHHISEYQHDYRDLSDNSLLDCLEEWLPIALAEKNHLKSITPENLHHALNTLMKWDALSKIDKLAPAFYKMPSGTQIFIDYSSIKTPSIHVRLQEVFGLFETPRIAEGKIPLTFYLLSPAMREVQVTQDLKSFWKEGYFHIRKELRGRYPKHYWPENPLEAQAIQGSMKKKNT